MHLTGRYPDWWPGVRFNDAIMAWVGSDTTETSREVVQAALLGTEEANQQHPDFGTGTIPGDAIAKITTRQAGVRDVVDQVIVKHESGRYSRVVLKTYDQGQRAWQGKKVKLVWLDEEPDHVMVYTEALTRTQAEPDGLLMFTRTALKGMTQIVARYLEPSPGDAPRHYTNMTLYDATGGIWPEETPWAGQAWEGHYKRDDIPGIIARYQDYERECRLTGMPMMGEGRVWPFSEDQIKCDPFEIPKYFARIIGIDFGIDHPFAVADWAWDRDADIFYLTFSWKAAGQLPAVHADVIKRRGEWIPVAWPHDGMNKEKGSGIELHKIYRDHLPQMLPYSARYDDETGGAQKIEPVVLEMHERMAEGRLKVFSTCQGFFEEYRNFHRKDGKIVPIKDDILKASMYGLMEKRSARTEILRPLRRPGIRPLRMTA